MGETISQKIISKAVGKHVEPGDIVEVNVDLVMVNDITGPLAIEVMKKVGVERVWDPSRVVVILDHQAPADNINSAELHIKMRNFVRKFGIKHFYDVGRGICHQILVEEGFTKPGDIVIGADSHTCTVGALGAFGIGVGSTDAASAILTGKIWLKVPESMKIVIKGEFAEFVSPKDLILSIIGDIGADGATYMAVEFTGETIRKMGISGRLTMCNMAVEMGAKTGIIEPDERILEYLARIGVGVNNNQLIRSDPDAEYCEIREYDVSKLKPMVAIPHRVDNVKPVEEVEGIEVDQVFIGSCTNGRVEDLLDVLRIVKGRKIAKNVRCIVIPASMKEFEKALSMGIIFELIRAGCLVYSPTCGPCLGGHLGVLGKDEVAVSTSNRNFIGRMGHKESKVYLVSPATAAATAITGKLTDPRRCR